MEVIHVCESVREIDRNGERGIEKYVERDRNTLIDRYIDR